MNELKLNNNNNTSEKLYELQNESIAGSVDVLIVTVLGVVVVVVVDVDYCM
jgi:hypothetical protein